MDETQEEEKDMESSESSEEQSVDAGDTEDGKKTEEKSVAKPKVESPKLLAKRADLAVRKKLLEEEKLLIAEEAEVERIRSLGGKSEAGRQPAKKVELTDEEYAEAVQRGERNPFKEDGIKV